ncbi:MAG: HpcH/HpaI aldolase/citrate lyase family protein [Ruminococcus sp.]|nr:HpcH/HpaI aldolase/citrate lyase family protein [Ruminococcus sp.]
MLDENISDREKYSVGALLYSPANSRKIIKQIRLGKIPPPYSAALCLEDSVADSAVSYAEECVIDTLKETAEIKKSEDVYIPPFFVRVRNPGQITGIYNSAGEYAELIKGFILPKYVPECAEDYNRAIIEVNAHADRKIYMMPILESDEIISVRTRTEKLFELKNIIDGMREYVLNVRVGGNDFCRIYGLRRNFSQTIYDIGVVNACLMDILNIFSCDYVVSAPVWEYFDTKSDDNWKTGLENEIRKDILNGFIGKTAIHPSQVPVINNMLKVTRQDYEDACSVAEWNNMEYGVNKIGKRMNEVKCHRKWAQKILAFADIYGIREDI